MGDIEVGSTNHFGFTDWNLRWLAAAFWKRGHAVYPKGRDYYAVFEMRNRMTRWNMFYTTGCIRGRSGGIFCFGRALCIFVRVGEQRRRQILWTRYCIARLWACRITMGVTFFALDSDVPYGDDQQRIPLQPSTRLHCPRVTSSATEHPARHDRSESC